MNKIKTYLLWILGIVTAYWSVKTNPLYGQQQEEDNLTKGDTVELVESHLLSVRPTHQVAAISTVTGQELYRTPAANLSNTLYGLLPGLTVLQGSGEPGYDAASLYIRGTGSYNGGDYAIFVDGFQSNYTYFQYLSSSEIATVSVLKDAAALTSLGMKGANGALWVTTKRGVKGTSSVSLQARTGFQRPIRINRPLDAHGYAMLYNEAYSNDQGNVWQPVYTDAELRTYRDGTGTNVDWYGQVLKEQTPFTSMDASFRGGNDVVRYFVLAGHMRSNGLYEVPNDDTHSNAGLQQFNIRANVDFDAFDIFEGKIDIGGRTEGRRYPNYTGSDLWYNLATYPSNIYPVRNPNGSWTGTPIYPDNPAASIRATGYNSTHDRTLQANFSLKEKLDFLTPGLYLRQAISFSTWTRGSYDVTRNYARYIGTQLQTTDTDTDFAINDDWGTNQWNYNQWIAEAGYSRDFGAHRIQATLNFLQSTFKNDANMNGDAGINTTYANRHLSARIHYGFADRYLAELSMAYSGSDNYAPGNRFGYYPALGLAWILSEENFLKQSPVVDFLKLRGSVGLAGYDGAVGSQRYLYQLYYGNAVTYPVGNGDPTWYSGLDQLYVPNPDIFAERSLKYNIGLDAALLRGLSLNVDVFMDKRSGIVSPDNSLLAVFGTTPPQRNIGRVTNRGFEAALAWQGKAGQWGYRIGAMAAYAANRIDYMAEVLPPTPHAAMTGRAIGTRFGYEAIGFYDVGDFDGNGNLISGIAVPGFGAVQPGDVRYRDVNADGVINDLDIQPLGNASLPKLNYAISLGLSYRGFDLSVLGQGVGKRTINLLDAASQIAAFQNFGNAYEIANRRWAYYPEQGIDTRATASYPRLSTVFNNNNYRSSSLWVKSADFLRIRNIELGYQLPGAVARAARLDNARIYISGVNLFTFSNILDDYGLDPETLTGYPGLKSLNVGFTVNF